MKNLPKNRNIYVYGKKIYIDYFKKGKRIRKSTGLNYSALSFAFVRNHYDLFLEENIRNLQEKYYELEQQQRNSFKQNPSIPNTFDQISQILLKEKSFLKANTNHTYSSLRKTILSFLEKHNIFYLNDFKREHSFLFLENLKEQNLKPKTITSLCFFLKSIFDYALENEALIKNPFFIPKMKQSLNLQKTHFKIFSLNEMIHLIKHSQGDLRLFLILAFFTGARTGEILALQYKDLDFQKNEIHIFKSLSVAGIIDTPKTKSSQRVIDMLELIKEELLPLKQKHSLQDFIIKSKRTSLMRQFYRLLENLNYEKRRLYDTRHSFASLMLSQGEEPMWVGCKMLGHKDLNETFRTYAKYLPKEVTHRATFLRGIKLT